MIDFYINPEAGRIGPFWWVNANTQKVKVANWLWTGSVHYVWRPGCSGWGFSGNFYWRIISQ
jgi:hypothetical protein